MSIMEGRIRNDLNVRVLPGFEVNDFIMC